MKKSVEGVGSVLNVSSRKGEKKKKKKLSASDSLTAFASRAVRLAPLGHDRPTDEVQRREAQPAQQGSPIPICPSHVQSGPGVAKGASSHSLLKNAAPNQPELPMGFALGRRDCLLPCPVSHALSPSRRERNESRGHLIMRRSMHARWSCKKLSEAIRKPCLPLSPAKGFQAVKSKTLTLTLTPCRQIFRRNNGDNRQPRVGDSGRTPSHRPIMIPSSRAASSNGALLHLLGHDPSTAWIPDI